VPPQGAAHVLDHDERQLQPLCRGRSLVMSRKFRGSSDVRRSRWKKLPRTE
jgi:hypothetical protein